jgi:hypothetical protein
MFHIYTYFTLSILKFRCKLFCWLFALERQWSLHCCSTILIQFAFLYPWIR